MVMALDRARVRAQIVDIVGAVVVLDGRIGRVEQLDQVDAVVLAIVEIVVEIVRVVVERMALIQAVESDRAV